MKKANLNVRTMCEIGIFAAIGYVLDELQGIISKGLFINGGSIGFAMVAVLFIAFRRGWLPAILTGLIIGGLDVSTGAYILHPAQLLLDYILPYTLVGLAGFFKPLFDNSQTKGKKMMWLAVGTFIGGVLKLGSHFAAGVIFWADPEYFAWGLNNMNVYLYCFLYNFAFIGPSIVLSGGLLIGLYVRAPKLLLDNNIYVPESYDTSRNHLQVISSSIFLSGGLFLFVYFLIKYIKSFYQEGGEGWVDFSFDADSMLIMLIGFFFVCLGIYSIISIRREKYSYKIVNIVFCFICADSFFYGLARLIRDYSKGKDPMMHWIWVGVGFIGLVFSIFALIYYKVKVEKKGSSI